MLRTLICTMLFLAAAGCQTPPPENLPEYSWVDGTTALRDLCERSRRVRSVSSEGVLTLTRSNGDSVRLDAAIVMRLPDSVRIRAWKFGQPVFDLTLTPGGLWIEAPQDPNRRGQVMPASLNAAKLARAWTVISGQFSCLPDVRLIDPGGSRFRVERTIDGQRVDCEVERATLTPRRYAVFDPAGVERFALTLDRYEMIQGIPWPVRLTAKSEGGVVVVEVKNPELNGELAPNAFVPPRRAEKMP